MSLAERVKASPKRNSGSETYYALPYGALLKGATLKRYKSIVMRLEDEAVLASKDTPVLTRKECQLMLLCIPEEEHTRIKKVLRTSMSEYGCDFESNYLQWVAICVIHAWERFQNNMTPPKKNSPKITLWNQSTPGDVLRKIRLERTAEGVLLPKTRPIITTAR